MSQNCAIPKRILAVHAVTGKAVVYPSIASAVRLNSDLDRPWRRSGILRSLAKSCRTLDGVYAGWRFTELNDGDPVPAGAQLAIDLHPVTAFAMPRILKNAPKVLISA